MDALKAQEYDATGKTYVTRHVFRRDDPNLAFRLLAINVPRHVVDAVLVTAGPMYLFAKPDYFGEAHTISIEV